MALRPELLQQLTPFSYAGYPPEVQRSFTEESDDVVIARIVEHLQSEGMQTVGKQTV